MSFCRDGRETGNACFCFCFLIVVHLPGVRDHLLMGNIRADTKVFFFFFDCSWGGGTWDGKIRGFFFFFSFGRRLFFGVVFGALGSRHQSIRV